MKQGRRIVLLVGGVGGAKLALGLQRVIAPENLTIIVNTGDDFWHYGLRICPDIDTLLYTLSGRVDSVNGWGLAQDTTTALDTLRTLGEEPWFRLGDKDIATHLLRTHLLRMGSLLTDVIHHLAAEMGVQPLVLPMTDQEVATMVDTVEYGELEFQEYFVRYRWAPVVKGLRYAGIEQARVSDAVCRAIEQADAIIFGPSNPWLSIGPVLAVPGLRDAIQQRPIPRIAVTPIVQGAALKGPAAKLMQELGMTVSPVAVAEYYGDVLTGFVYDQRDHIEIPQGLRSKAFDTIMMSDESKIRLAQQIIDWIDEMEQA